MGRKKKWALEAGLVKQEHTNSFFNGKNSLNIRS
jgi:hypothetical protein